MANKILISVIFLCLVCLCYASFNKVVVAQKDIMLSPNEELLYFPNGEKLKLASLGYNNALANYLWFQTVSYFGKHFRSDQKYYWLSHMCNTITDLDPYHKEIYEFCALLIAWEVNQVGNAQKIISKGINNNQDYWRFYYLRAMNNIMFQKDENSAKDDLVKASKLESAPLFVRRLAAKKIANLNDPLTAIAFLEESIRNAKDDAQKAALTEHLKKTIHEYNFSQLEKMLDTFKEQYSKDPIDIFELRAVGLREEQLQDPFGGKYFINSEGKIDSTSDVKRISLFDKEKETNDSSH